MSKHVEEPADPAADAAAPVAPPAGAAPADDTQTTGKKTTRRPRSDRGKPRTVTAAKLPDTLIGLIAAPEIEVPTGYQAFRTTLILNSNKVRAARAQLCKAAESDESLRDAKVLLLLAKARVFISVEKPKKPKIIVKDV